jgi:hypothetical protein
VLDLWQVEYDEVFGRFFWRKNLPNFRTLLPIMRRPMSDGLDIVSCLLRGYPITPSSQARIYSQWS